MEKPRIFSYLSLKKKNICLSAASLCVCVLCVFCVCVCVLCVTVSVCIVWMWLCVCLTACCVSCSVCVLRRVCVGPYGLRVWDCVCNCVTDRDYV